MPQIGSVALLNDVDVVVWEARLDPFRFTFVSEHSERLLGYPAANWLGDASFWRAHLHAEDRARVWEQRAAAIRAGRDHSLEYRMLTARGRAMRVRDQARLVRTATGDVDRIAGVIFQVTPRGLAEHAVVPGGTIGRAPLEGAHGILSVLDSEGRYLFVGASVRGMGWEPAQLLGRDAFERVHPDDRAAVRKEFARLLHSPGTHGRFSCRHQGPDGCWHSVEADGANVLGASAMGAVIVFAPDLTPRLEAQDSLHASEEQYRVLVEALDSAVVLVDARGVVIAFNPAAAALCGVEPRGALGRALEESPWEIRDAAGQPMAHAERPILRALRAGVAVEGAICRIVPANGGPERWVRVNTRPIRLSPGTPPAFAVSTFTDITEQRHLEEQLLHTRKMEAIGRLAGGVAHDFNNLLTALQGYSELLIAEIPGGSPLREYVEQIQRAGERAAQLTRQLLAFGRRQRLEHRALDVAEVVAGLEPMLRRVLPETISLEIDLASIGRRIRADRNQLEQVLLNLVINARDALDRGGRIVLAVRECTREGREPGLRLDAPPGRYVTLEVRDDGVGMDATTLERIFEPFFTTKAPGRGTGLGLASVHALVEQCGGAIAVESSPGRGTAFRIHLPEAIGQAARTPVVAERRSSPGRGERVLVVEDEAAVRTLVASVLRSHGYEVTVARDAAEAFALVPESGHRWELLLTDVVLPGEDGRGLARRLRGRFPDLAVCFMTGYAREPDTGGEAEPDGSMLAKPFGPAQLLAVVRDTLAGVRRHDAGSPKVH